MKKKALFLSPFLVNLFCLHSIFEAIFFSPASVSAGQNSFTSTYFTQNLMLKDAGRSGKKAKEQNFLQITTGILVSSFMHLSMLIKGHIRPKYIKDICH